MGCGPSAPQDVDALPIKQHCRTAFARSSSAPGGAAQGGAGPAPARPAAPAAPGEGHDIILCYPLSGSLYGAELQARYDKLAAAAGGGGGAYGKGGGGGSVWTPEQLLPHPPTPLARRHDPAGRMPSGGPGTPRAGAPGPPSPPSTAAIVTAPAAAAAEAAGPGAADGACLGAGGEGGGGSVHVGADAGGGAWAQAVSNRREGGGGIEGGGGGRLEIRPLPDPPPEAPPSLAREVRDCRRGVVALIAAGSTWDETLLSCLRLAARHARPLVAVHAVQSCPLPAPEEWPADVRHLLYGTVPGSAVQPPVKYCSQHAAEALALIGARLAAAGGGGGGALAAAGGWAARLGLGGGMGCSNAAVVAVAAPAAVDGAIQELSAAAVLPATSLAALQAAGGALSERATALMKEFNQPAALPAVAANSAGRPSSQLFPALPPAPLSAGTLAPYPPPWGTRVAVRIPSASTDGDASGALTEAAATPTPSKPATPTPTRGTACITPSKVEPLIIDPDDAALPYSPIEQAVPGAIQVMAAATAPAAWGGGLGGALYDLPQGTGSSSGAGLGFGGGGTAHCVLQYRHPSWAVPVSYLCAHLEQEPALGGVVIQAECSSDAAPPAAPRSGSGALAAAAAAAVAAAVAAAAHSVACGLGEDGEPRTPAAVLQLLQQTHGSQLTSGEGQEQGLRVLLPSMPCATDPWVSGGMSAALHDVSACAASSLTCPGPALDAVRAFTPQSTDRPLGQSASTAALPPPHSVRRPLSYGEPAPGAGRATAPQSPTHAQADNACSNCGGDGGRGGGKGGGRGGGGRVVVYFVTPGPSLSGACAAAVAGALTHGSAVQLVVDAECCQRLGEAAPPGVGPAEWQAVRRLWHLRLLYVTDYHTAFAAMLQRAVAPPAAPAPADTMKL